MAEAHPLTRQHRAQQLVVGKDASSKTARLWTSLDYDNLDATYPAFASRIATLVKASRQTSAGLASRYLRDFRKASGVRGDLSVALAGPINHDQLAISLRVTSVVAIKAATSAGIAHDVAMANALTLTRGSVSRLVLEAGRKTVTGTAIRDPRARGWQRVGTGQCEFCQMLLGRGAVYTEATADFEAHDHCGCTAEPAF